MLSRFRELPYSLPTFQELLYNTSPQPVLHIVLSCLLVRICDIIPFDVLLLVPRPPLYTPYVGLSQARIWLCDCLISFSFLDTPARYTGKQLDPKPRVLPPTPNLFLITNLLVQ